MDIDLLLRQQTGTGKQNAQQQQTGQIRFSHRKY